MKIEVRNNNVEKALRLMKKKMKTSGVFQELKDRQYYQKPSEIKREKAKQRGRRNAGAKRAGEQRASADESNCRQGGRRARKRGGQGGKQSKLERGDTADGAGGVVPAQHGEGDA